MVVDRKALASIVLALISLIYFPLLTGFLAIITGHLSRSSIKHSHGELRGKNIALTGLVIGYLTLSSVLLIFWQRAHVAQNESSAVASLRSLNSGFETYVQSHPGSYPVAFSQLDKSGVDAMLVAGQKDGYRFTYEIIEKDVSVVDYMVQAEPLQPGLSGRRTFCLAKGGDIHAAQPGQKCTKTSPRM
jgi:hypothetical protein